MKKKTAALIKLTQLSMLAALGVVLMLLVRFPLFPSAAFLEYDMGDVPVLIATFLFGPLQGMAVLVAVSLIQAFTVSSASGWIGFVMHVAASGLFVLICGVILKKFKKKTAFIFALAAGTVAMSAIMIPLNLIFTVHFLGQPRQAVIDMLLPVILPFNLIKGIINSVVSFALYFPLRAALRKSHILPESKVGKK